MKHNQFIYLGPTHLSNQTSKRHLNAKIEHEEEEARDKTSREEQKRAERMKRLKAKPESRDNVRRVNTKQADKPTT